LRPAARASTAPVQGNPEPRPLCLHVFEQAMGNVESEISPALVRIVEAKFLTKAQDRELL